MILLPTKEKLKHWLTIKTFHYLGSVHEPLYTWLNAIANTIILLRHPEKVTHPGSLHPDRTFYIIRDFSSYVGIAGWYDRALGYVLRADKKGWTPIIDAQPPAQADDGDWYAFFKGASDIPLSEALHGKNVVLATPQGMIHKRYNRANIARRHPVCARIPLSEAANAFVSARIGKIFEGAPTDMVAIRFRGTDYRSHGSYCPTGHAKVPAVSDFCDRVVADMEKWGVPVGEGEHIYLVTEEQEALVKIRRRFPKCRFVEKERYANFDFKSYLTRQRLPTMTPLENNMMYLLEIFAMARCDYLIGGVNGGVLMALNLNGNAYKGVDVLDTGVS